MMFNSFFASMVETVGGLPTSLISAVSTLFTSSEEELVLYGLVCDENGENCEEVPEGTPENSGGGELSDDS
jgi:hypothetical protein